VSPSYRHKIDRFIKTRFAVLSLIANLALVLLAFWLHHTYIYEQWKRFGLSIVLFLAVALVDYWFKEIHDREQKKEIYELTINDFLKAAARSTLQMARPPKQHIRANVMVKNEEKNVLWIKFDHGFDPEDNDKNIEVPVGTGCSGQSWVKNSLLAEDLTVISTEGIGAHWGIPEGEAKKIRPSLRSILSVPILSPTQRGIVAILNLDSDNTKDEMKFDDPGMRQTAHLFASVLGRMLDHV
jgi:hypothetical protein